MTSFLLKLYARLGSSAGALEKAQILATEMLQVAPAPTVLIYSDTFNIVHASKTEDMIAEEPILKLVRLYD
ncbi:MAG: hypothetical protein ACREV4_01015 [Gammaproteobacteria bacterium]